MGAAEKWNTVKLQDIAEFKTGKLNSNAAVINGKYPFFTCSRETFMTNTWSFDCECVLLAGNNANAEYPVKYFKGKFDAYQRTYVITTKDPKVLNIRYLYYGIELKLNLLKSLSTGAATRFITKGIIDNLEFNLPDINEQNLIVNTLAAYDNLIENNNSRIAILEEMAQSLYREWFVKFRFPGHEDTKFIDSSLGVIPDGWEVVALEDICERITDGAHKSPKSVDDGVPMASVKDMHDYGLNLSTCRQISEEDYFELERQDSVVRRNDVLIAKDGSYLKHTFVVEKDEKVALLSSIAMLRPNEKVKPHWLAYCLRSENVKERMKQCVSGVAVPRIILKDFRQFKIVLPPQILQNEWNLVVEQFVKLCWKLIRKNQNLKSQRDMLLPKLVSGVIDVSDKVSK